MADTANVYAVRVSETKVVYYSGDFEFTSDYAAHSEQPYRPGLLRALEAWSIEFSRAAYVSTQGVRQTFQVTFGKPAECYSLFPAKEKVYA